MVRLGMMISDRYEIIEKVGSGGMADVFRAKCHRLNRFVAIKFLKQEYSQDMKFVTKFTGEAQSVAGLSHPNIVSIYDVGEDNGLNYIVMEYVDGITLKKFIEERGKLPVKEAVEIGLQIASGLYAAHANNIIHRDIKPQNILISKDGVAKVTDFGIAKAASSNTITSNAMGSVHYISPEQARGGFSDEKSDIYSLGVTMYEMLCGKLPFTGESTVAVALAHVQDDPTPLAAMDPEIPLGLSNIVAKCMQKKQEMRYLTAADLIQDLKKFLNDPNGIYGKVTPLDMDKSPTIFISDEDVNIVKDVSRKKGQIEEPEEEPEEESDVDPKLEKALVFGSIAVAIIIGIILIVLVGRLLGFWGGSKVGTTTPSPSSTPVATAAEGEVIVPDVKDDKKEEAIVEFDNLSLKYEIEEQESDTTEEGYVIGTDPAEGTSVDKNATVKIFVSSGKEKVAVPDVNGSSLEDARTALLDAGFKVVEEGKVYSDSVEKGLVAYTSPKAGKKAAAGSTVKIYESKGKEDKTTTVPDLSGLTKSKAKAAIKSAGLVVGNIDNAYSDSYPKNRVCAQSRKSGTTVDKGSTIDFILSLGKETTYKYLGSVSIQKNPFDYESDPAAVIKIVLVQDGRTKILREKSMNYNNFPLSLDTVYGYSTSDGEVKVYKDGVLDNTYNISFTKVSA